ncbi:hypothetical protein CYY_009640 [Polysphondylium violaceum]|uniref:Transmembrane protein n=1 Tax=Polysphondylium violaceum TaxID=133409 RepID=A0A8J4PJY0_9MYCE|nr:hypothetical protein CYY_009640 [Polysphondylium violaceum]
MKFLILLLFLFSFWGGFLNAGQVVWDGTTGNWETPTNWDTDTLPGAADIVFMIKNNSVITSNAAHQVDIVIVGYQVDYPVVKFIANKGLTCSEFQIKPNATAIFNLPLPTDTFSGDIFVEGTFETNLFFNSNSFITIKSGLNSKYQNFAKSKYYGIDNYQTFYSNNDITVTDVWQNRALMNILNGVIDIQPNSLYMNDSFTFFKGATVNSKSFVTKVYQTAGLTIRDSTYKINNINYDENDEDSIGVFRSQDSAQVSIENSKLLLNNTNYYNLNDSLSNFENSQITLNQAFLNEQRAVAQFSNTTLFTTHVFQLDDDTQVFLRKNSSLTIQDKHLGMYLNSFMELRDSNLTINSINTDLSILGLFNDSTLAIVENSKFSLDGHFLVCNTSTLIVSNSSYVSIRNILQGTEDSYIKVVNSSTIEIFGNVILFETSTFTAIDSNVIVHGYFHLWDSSWFVFRKAKVNIIGRLQYVNEEPLYYSQMDDSEVDVNGVLLNAGNLKINNTLLDVQLNFTTYGTFEAQNSRIIVRAGIFYTKGKLSSYGTNFTVHNGLASVGDDSQFFCEKCIIEINQGNLKQGRNSNVTLLSTVLKNNNGIVTSLSDYIVNPNSLISNNATFILTTNVLAVLDNNNKTDSFIENTGNFEISGGTTTEINIPFKNNGGILNVQQNSTFISLHQNNGTLGLNGGTVSSNSTIEISGGSVSGNGEIGGNVNNTGGSIGGSDTNHIKINGNYTQSDNGQIVITINDEQDLTTLNISGNANIENSTIVIRVNEMITVEKNATVVSSANIVGTFGSIVFKTFSPTSGQETTTKTCVHSSSTNNVGFSVLLNQKDKVKCTTSTGGSNTGGSNTGGSNTGGSNTGGSDTGGSISGISGNGSYQVDNGNSDVSIFSGSSSLSKGTVIGVVVGVVGAVAIVGGIIYFRNRIPTGQQLRNQLKNLSPSRRGSKGPSVKLGQV